LPLHYLRGFPFPTSRKPNKTITTATGIIKMFASGTAGLYGDIFSGMPYGIELLTIDMARQLAVSFSSVIIGSNNYSVS
jgi:hypothetical protein